MGFSFEDKYLIKSLQEKKCGVHMHNPQAEAEKAAAKQRFSSTEPLWLDATS